MAPHLDKGERVTRAHAAELSAAARDREVNAARIREGIQSGRAGIGGVGVDANRIQRLELDAPIGRGCQRCGDPYAAINADGTCDLCEQDAKLDGGARDKLGPEELYPEHFSESTHENEEVE